MNKNSKWNTTEIFDCLLEGSDAHRNNAIEAIDELTETEKNKLCEQIYDKVLKDFKPTKNENRSVGKTRSWLFNALAKICKDKIKASKLVRKHLYLDYEPNPYVRYWSLVGLISDDVPDLEKLARKITKQPKEDEIIIILAEAILASKGDRSFKKKIEEDFNDPKKRWCVLYSLGKISVPDMLKELKEIVEKDINKESKANRETYHAIVALGKAPATKEQAEDVALLLQKYLIHFRHSTLRDGLRARALETLGNIKLESSVPYLIESLTYNNPNLVREGAYALAKVVGIPSATARIIETISKTDKRHIEGYVQALKWINKDNIVENELETAMVSGSLEKQEAARTLLSLIGGPIAFQKLRARTIASSQYTNLLEKAEDRIQTHFETSIKEARNGFKIATAMDLIVFFLGISLLAFSAYIAIINTGTLENWISMIFTTGTGAVGVIYGTLVAKPRNRVKESVKNLMYLKVVFLAYLRQLHQIDQAYTRLLLEKEKLKPEDITSYSEMIKTTMLTATDKLNINNKDEK